MVYLGYDTAMEMTFSNDNDYDMGTGPDQPEEVPPMEVPSRPETPEHIPVKS